MSEKTFFINRLSMKVVLLSFFPLNKKRYSSTFDDASDGSHVLPVLMKISRVLLRIYKRVGSAISDPLIDSM